jgi:trimethylamine--corrinoid protein Co-methyltransferase
MVRANAIWKRALAEFTPPPIDAGIREAIEEFRARSAASGGASIEE